MRKHLLPIINNYLYNTPLHVTCLTQRKQVFQSLTHIQLYVIRKKGISQTFSTNPQLHQFVLNYA